MAQDSVSSACIRNIGSSSLLDAFDEAIRSADGLTSDVPGW